MTKKISQTILSVGLAVVILSTALFCAALTGHFTERVFRELEAEADHHTASDIRDARL